jgi:hypothetical protein
MNYAFNQEGRSRDLLLTTGPRFTLDYEKYRGLRGKNQT